MRAIKLAALLAVTASVPAHPAAWTRAPGESFVSAAVGWFATDDGAYTETTMAIYGEHGLREALTIGGSIEFVRPDGDDDGAAANQDFVASTFARLRLFEGARGDVVSVHVGFGGPAGDAVGAAPAQTADEPALDLRLLYGRGFSTRYGDAFLNAEGGLRFRLEESADELRLDLTAGLRPAEGWLVMAQSFATLGMRNADPGGDDYDVLKIAPSLGREVMPGLTLLFGVERDVAGRDIDPGTRLKLSIWTEF